VIESEGLHKAADRIVKYMYRTGKRVAVLGGLGVGKSVLINELLGIPEICVTSPGTRTYTQVAMSYQYLDDNDGKRPDNELVVIVQFFTYAEVLEHIAMHGANVWARYELDDDYDNNVAPHSRRSNVDKAFIEGRDRQAMDWFRSVADIAYPGQNMREYMDKGRSYQDEGKQYMDRAEGLAFEAIKAS
jgi:hypothetical protein